MRPPDGGSISETRRRLIAQWLAAHDHPSHLPLGEKRGPIPIRGPRAVSRAVSTRPVVKAPKKRYGVHGGLQGHTKPHRYDYS